MAAAKRILIFAHTPPPHHGQSVMVQLLIAELRRHPEVVVHHVNARVSDELADVGSFRAQKLWRLLKYCIEALAIRRKHGPMALYYVPAPVKRSAVVRDWIVMALCRPAFSGLILHWHAYGLGTWATSGSSRARWLTRKALKGADLSIVLTGYNREDAAKLEPHRIAVIPNGIPDPCPDFSTSVLPRRLRRAERHREQAVFRCLFLAHCTEEKGLFDAIEAFALARRAMSDSTGTRLELTVAGNFTSERERQRFFDRIVRDDLTSAGGASSVSYAGFLGEEAKDVALRDHDCMIFPSRWESFGLSAVEALAYGLPAVISDHPNLLSLIPEPLRFAASAEDHPGLAEAIVRTARFTQFGDLRECFLQRFGVAPFGESMLAALWPTAERQQDS